MYIVLNQDLFKALGTKFIDPNYEEAADEEEKEQQRIRKETVKINKKDGDGKEEGKKGCC